MHCIFHVLLGDVPFPKMWHEHALVSRISVWGDALGLYRHFCKSAGSDEAQPEVEGESICSRSWAVSCSHTLSYTTAFLCPYHAQPLTLVRIDPSGSSPGSVWNTLSTAGMLYMGWDSSWWTGLNDFQQNILGYHKACSLFLAYCLSLCP